MLREIVIADRYSCRVSARSKYQASDKIADNKQAARPHICGCPAVQRTASRDAEERAILISLIGTTRAALMTAIALQFRGSSELPDR